MYKLSLVVSIYNIEQYVGRSIESLLNQNSKEYEIILIDDGSTDRTSEICKAYAKNDDRITYYFKKNGGLSSARNYGLTKSRGEYVFFIDGDDYIEKNSVSKIIDLIQVNNLDMLHINYREVDDNKKVLKEFIDNNSLEGKIYTGEDWVQQARFVTMAWAYVFKKDFLINNGLTFYEGIYHEDMEFTPRAISKAKKIQFISTPVYNYVIRAGSIIRSCNIKKAYDLLIVAKNLEKFRMAEGSNLTIHKFLTDRISYTYWISILSVYTQNGKYNEFFKDEKVKSDILRGLATKKSFKYKCAYTAIKYKRYMFIKIMCKYKVNRGN